MGFFSSADDLERNHHCVFYITKPEYSTAFIQSSMYFYSLRQFNAILCYYLLCFRRFFHFSHDLIDNYTHHFLCIITGVTVQLVHFHVFKMPFNLNPCVRVSSYIDILPILCYNWVQIFVT